MKYRPSDLYQSWQGNANKYLTSGWQKEFDLTNHVEKGI